MIISFTIQGVPIAKGRPKFFRCGNYTGTYTPAKTKRYEESVISQALPHRPSKPIEKPIALFLKFYMPIPKSMPKKNRQAITEGRLFPAKKPDIDNLCKAILDSLNKIYYKDDSLIVRITAEKIYSETPRTEVKIETLP